MMNREVSVYLGFPEGCVANETFNPTLLNDAISLTNWKDYKWFKATVNIPIDGITELEAVDAKEIGNE